MKLPIINKKPKECPFCHKYPEVIKDELWRGTHGYYMHYEYYVACVNTGCKIRPKTHSYDDIYGMTEEECINSAIEDWNCR